MEAREGNARLPRVERWVVVGRVEEKTKSEDHSSRSSTVK